MYEDIAKVWDEISFVKANDTEVEKANRTYIWEKDRIRQRIILMRNKMKQMYDYLYPIERRVMEDRLSFLEKQYASFEYAINPYHVNPGILLDVDITSIKRKKATLDAMANVLNEFLSGVSKGFSDAAFASFSRRRSTVREDLAQSFAAPPVDEKEGEGAAAGADYMAAINAGGNAVPAVADATPKALPAAPAKRGRKPKAVVDATPSRRGRRKAAEATGLTEV
jgi:hypothetical protein